MIIEVKQDLIKIKVYGLHCEITGMLCHVYKPRKTMGEKLGSFICEGMPIDVLLDQIRTYLKLV